MLFRSVKANEDQVEVALTTQPSAVLEQPAAESYDYPPSPQVKSSKNRSRTRSVHGSLVFGMTPEAGGESGPLPKMRVSRMF